MEEPSDESGTTPIEQLRDFLGVQLADLEDPRNVHQVRERLYGRRWAETLDLEALEAGVAEPIVNEVGRAWAALSRYPWDLHGAQRALQAAIELSSD
ncbi:MAG: hypothetical protein WD766_06855 [Gemmatimonadota bacterium]